MSTSVTFSYTPFVLYKSYYLFTINLALPDKQLSQVFAFYLIEPYTIRILLNVIRLDIFLTSVLLSGFFLQHFSSFSLFWVSSRKELVHIRSHYSPIFGSLSLTAIKLRHRPSRLPIHRYLPFLWLADFPVFFSFLI